MFFLHVTSIINPFVIVLDGWMLFDVGWGTVGTSGEVRVNVGRRGYVWGGMGIKDTYPPAKLNGCQNPLEIAKNLCGTQNS
jgi:hypothetical protein